MNIRRKVWPALSPEGFSPQLAGTSITRSSSMMVTVVVQTWPVEQFWAVESNTLDAAVNCTTMVSSSSHNPSAHGLIMSKL